MAVLNDEKSRTDLLHRLKRAEGQLRGIQRMIQEGEDCLSIASQMSAGCSWRRLRLQFTDLCFRRLDGRSGLLLAGGCE
mgnify:CR=1 FL=1